MTQFHNPPTVSAGVRWDSDEFQRYVLDNLQAIHDILTSPLSSSFAINEVLIGLAGGLIGGLALSNGGLLTEDATGLVDFPIGNNGQFLQAHNGFPRYHTITITVDRITALRLR